MATRSATRAPKWGEHMKRGALRSGALFGAMALIALATLLAMALGSFRPSDPALNTAAGGVTHNWASVPGAWVADILLTAFGPAVILIIPLIIVIARRMWHDLPVGNWSRRMAQCVLGIMLVDVALGMAKHGAMADLPAGMGGGIGTIGATSVDALSTLIPLPNVAYWALKAVGVVVAMVGIAVWARSLGLDARDYDWLKRKPKPPTIDAPAATHFCAQSK